MIRYRYSRLNRLQDQNTKLHIGLLIAGCILILLLIIKVGVPALFALSGTLTSLNKSGAKDTQEASWEIPPVPTLTSEHTATSSAFVKLNGHTDPDLNVVIEKNNEEISSIVSGVDGTFEVVADLTKGTNIFRARTVNAAGKKSEASDVVTVVNITGNPKLEVNFPTDGQTFSSEDSIQVTGKTDPGNSVSVNDRAAIVGIDGSFKFFFRLTSGDNKLTIVATDPAGNSSKKELIVKRS